MAAIGEILVASGNRGKIGEIRDILAPLGISLRSLRDVFDPLPHIEETGATFEDNARLKARWIFSRTGVCTLADDSGLEVDALGGEPGVRSARYAGDQSTDERNNAKLLGLLKDVPAERRTARFRCVVVLIPAAGQEICTQGVCEGTMGFAPRGTSGFGYDPLFIPRGYTHTFAELTPAVKHTLSHRGQALEHLKLQMQELTT
jgi:XTP/dITP diphosphohydrolase